MSVVSDAFQFGTDPLPSRNFHIASNGDGSASLNKGNHGSSLQNILEISATGAVSAGVQPATGDRTAALATMKKFDDEFLKSHSASGWQKLPSGLILQWVNLFLNCVNNDTNGFKSEVQAWPLTFPTRVLCGNVSHIGATKNLNVIFHQDYFEKNGFILATPYVSGTASFLVTAIGN